MAIKFRTGITPGGKSKPTPKPETKVKGKGPEKKGRKRII